MCLMQWQKPFRCWFVLLRRFLRSRNKGIEMKMNLKLSPGKVAAYFLALLLFGSISALALIVSAVFIAAGFALMFAVLSGAGLVILWMKMFTNFIPKDHPVLH